MNKDSFQRQKDSQPLKKEEAAAPLPNDSFQRQAGTAPVRPGTGLFQQPKEGTDVFQRREGAVPATGLLPSRSRPLITPAALKALTEDTLAKAQPLVASLEPRVELLMRACQVADLPIPGVVIGEFKHPLTPNAQKIIVYLHRALKVREGLARQVQVAVFRYQEACQIVAQAQQATQSEALTPHLLEDLKRKCFYLTNYHEEFKMDPILTQIFPPPKNGTTGNLRKPGTAVLSQTEMLKQKKARDQMLAQAEGLIANLGPKMEVVKIALPMLSKSTGTHLIAFIQGTDKRALAMARKLKGDQVAESQLKRAVELYGQLAPQLEIIHAGGGVEKLTQIVAELGHLAATWQAHPYLKEFVARSTQELFSDA